MRVSIGWAEQPDQRLRQLQELKEIDQSEKQRPPLQPGTMQNVPLSILPIDLKEACKIFQICFTTVLLKFEPPNLPNRLDQTVETGTVQSTPIAKTFFALSQ